MQLSKRRKKKRFLPSVLLSSVSYSFCSGCLSVLQHFLFSSVDQTARIRACVGSRNNDEYINHNKSESVCYVYGHRGDGIYLSLSCSAHIIRYATSQSFGKKKTNSNR